MNVITNGGEDLADYEYKEVTATRCLEDIYAKGYPNFGWKLEERSLTPVGHSAVDMRFKREHRIRNKAELTRLQRKFEQEAAEIGNLERSKRTAAIITALTVGLVGTVFLAGATFAFICAAMIPLMIALAIPGFIGWFLPYPLYRKIRAKKSATVTPLIQQQYDAIFQVCEKGHALLA